MAIGNIQVIQIGLPNESTGSDSLYSAFTKTQTNFTTLFGCASPYNNFVGNTGISTSANANTGTISITNTGVTNIIAGTNITIDQSNGNVTISSSGGGNGNSSGTVTSVGVVPISTDRLTVTNSPVISSGNISIDLSNSGVTAGNYSYPSLTVDQYGRITNIANANSLGTVTSVGLITSGTGIQISGGPITTAGNITVINTGVTRLTAGTGIGLSGSNGNITVSATQIGGTVTSVGLSSTSLTVSSGAITTAGTLTVDLPPNIQVSGSLTLSSGESLLDGAAASLAVTASYITVTGASTATLAAGNNGLIKTFMMYALSNGGDMVITVANAGWKSSGTGTITIGTLGAGCTLQYINNKWFCIGQNGVTFG
jgi:hypothetical protein